MSILLFVGVGGVGWRGGGGWLGGGFGVAVLGVSFVCPFLLIWLQKWKFEINGPWDEAKL